MTNFFAEWYCRTLVYSIFIKNLGVRCPPFFSTELVLLTYATGPTIKSAFKCVVNFFYQLSHMYSNILFISLLDPSCQIAICRTRGSSVYVSLAIPIISGIFCSLLLARKYLQSSLSEFIFWAFVAENWTRPMSLTQSPYFYLTRNNFQNFYFLKILQSVFCPVQKFRSN